MVQLFVRGAGPGTTCVDVEAGCSVSGLQQCIQDCIGIPVDYQGFVYGGRQLEESTSLHSYGISAGSTVQLVYRMLGGKGGFGAQLRSMGRDGKVTDNFDACRDLSGRRVRHQVAEQKLAKWKEDAPQRELEAIAMKHIKEEARKARKAEAEEVDVAAIRSAQEEAISRTQQAVLDALGSTANNTAHSSKTSTATAPGSAGTAGAGAADGSPGTKRKAAASTTSAAPPAAKKSKMLACLEDVSDDSSEEE